MKELNFDHLFLLFIAIIFIYLVHCIIKGCKRIARLRKEKFELLKRLEEKGDDF